MKNKNKQPFVVTHACDEVLAAMALIVGWYWRQAQDLADASGGEGPDADVFNAMQDIACWLYCVEAMREQALVHSN